MSLSIGIVGLPNVGKSTLFNALLKRQQALAANYPFATIEPNIGIVDVPDVRLEKLAEFVRNDYGERMGDKIIPERIIPAVVKFYDIAGLVKGAHEGEGLGNEFLGHIRDVDAIIHVVRDFKDTNIIKAGSVDIKNDIDVVNTELILADISLLEKKIRFLEGEMRGNRSKDILKKYDLYNLILRTLNENKMANTLNLSDEDKIYLRDLNLLTTKPMIYVLNVDEDSLSKKDTQSEDIVDIDSIRICAKIECELALLDDAERKEYMKELDINESGLDQIIRKGYEILGLETYFTAGPKEVRAWTILKQTKAPQAAGKIHTDFERGFISCSVINFKELSLVESMKKAKDKGLIKLEGKNYTVCDGDVIEFNFSV